MPRKRPFTDPDAVAEAMANAFMLYVRTIGLNAPDLATAALNKVHEQLEPVLQQRGMAAGDIAAVLGAFDLCRAALGPEDRRQ